MAFCLRALVLLVSLCQLTLLFVQDFLTNGD